MSKRIAIVFALAFAFACAHGQPSSDTAAEPPPKPAPPRNAFEPVSFARAVRPVQPTA